MDIHFNTGRLYTKDGQIIRAVWDAEKEVVHFADFSRAINGSIEAPTYAAGFTRPGSLAMFVMERYDRGAYKNTPESWELLMVTGRDQSAKVEEFTI